MAQLPPKIPVSMSNCTNWPNSFPHQRLPGYANVMPMSDAATPQQQQQCWDADEFADFAAARRGSHRRSVSDSVAFLDYSAAPLVHDRGFDHHDEEQQLMMMSMFSDDLSSAAPPTLSSSSNPSSPSDGGGQNIDELIINRAIMPPALDHNNDVVINQQPKAEPGEVESPPPPSSAAADPVVDPKRVKRILANRQSAQRSRVRKLQYISELERSVTTLQSEVSALSPRVAFLDHQRLILNVDNSALKQRIAALAQDKIFKDAHQEALKTEIERLRQVYHQQNLKKMGSPNAQCDPHYEPQYSSDAIGCADN